MGLHTYTQYSVIYESRELSLPRHVNASLSACLNSVRFVFLNIYSEAAAAATFYSILSSRIQLLLMENS